MAALNIKNLPDVLYRKLRLRARRNHRSIAQEVTQLLTDALETRLLSRNGRPVARLMPVSVHRLLSPTQQTARARVRARMARGWPIAAGQLDRDSLHRR